MCLSNSKKIEIHNEPIKAYKILIKIFPSTNDETYKEGELRSPYYRGFKWNIGEMMTAEGEIKVKEMMVDGEWGHDAIDEGAFHAFKKPSEQERYFDLCTKDIWTAWSLPGSPTCKYVLAEVEIPQDAEVYEGDYLIGFGTSAKSYASSKMKVVRVLKDGSWKKEWRKAKKNNNSNNNPYVSGN